MTENMCPICGDTYLELDLPDGPDGPYKVSCPRCGTRFHHDLLYHGINGAHKFLLDIDGSEPEVDFVENWAYDDTTTWECSGCLKKRTFVKGEPPFRFCPDCGKPVESRGEDE